MGGYFAVEVRVSGKAWKTWLVPGGVILALVAGLVNSPFFILIAPSLGFYYAAVFFAGLILSWRFHSTRIFFSLVTLLLAHRAVEFFSAGHVTAGPGNMALILAALLVPINFSLFAVVNERGFVVAGIAPRALILFLESVAVAVLCRPENSVAHPRTVQLSAIPLWALSGFAVAAGVFVQRFLKTRRPVEPGFVWSAIAALAWIEFAPVGKMADAYVATAGLILAASLVETSYVLAYHDELTGIRGRRAFNEALSSLDQQYAIAIVDIDHFKKFNDTFGHDVGDQVLCMVAARISEVSGSGQAFRCGGEEFAVIFRDLSAKDALEHLERLRATIEEAQFKVRGAERRSKPVSEGVEERRAGESDRRKTTRSSKKKAAASGISTVPDCLSVTVSIGVGEPSTRYRQPDQVIQAADQALYRAKQKGRNRVELASTAPLRVAADKRAKARL